MKVKQAIQLFKSAMRGDKHDYTSLSLNRAIFLLAIPMIIEMAMESLFAVVDVFFVGRLGTAAVSAVGLTESMLTIVYSIAFGVAMAATAMVARRIGEKDEDGASRAAGQTILIALSMSVIICLIGIFFSEKLLNLMGASPEVIDTGLGFTRWMLCGNFVIMMIFVLNGIFRGAGDAGIAMRVLWISNSINIVLDPLLIFGLGPIPGFGVEGAAIATNIGRGIGVTYQCYVLFNGKGVLKVLKRHLVASWKIILRLIDIAAGGAGQFIISSASWIFLMKIMSEFGDEAVAGYTISIRILIFTILPAWGMANAAATLVGQNLGAGNPDRAENSVWRTALYNMIFLGIVSIFYLAFAGPIVRIFTDDPEVIEVGTQSLTYISLGYVFFAFGMVVMQAFNGAGDTRTPTWLNIIGFWAIQIPVAYLLALNLDMGPKGVFLAILIAESILATLSVVMFRRGKWKLKEV